MRLIFCITIKLNLLFYLCLLAYAVADIVELRAANLAAAGDVHLDDVRGVNRECLFDADSVRDFSDGESFGNAAVFLGDDHAVEQLNAFSRSLFDFVVYNDRITDFKFGKLGL